MSSYNPNRDSGEAKSRNFVEVDKADLQGLVEESEGIPLKNQRYFAQIIYMINESNNVKGYNPNKDSGIAEPRSYVEVNKDNLQGLTEEFEEVPADIQRYFAKIVFNIGS